MNLTRVRRFSFNIHKYKEKGYTHQKLLDEFVNGWKIDYMVIGQEKTELGIEHLQGYVEFQNATFNDSSTNTGTVTGTITDNR